MAEQEEVLNLIKRAQNGDDEAKSILVERNSPLVKSMLRRYRNKGVEYDDLFQLGCIGLLKAIKNFSEEYDVKFSTYAVPMIIGEIKRYMRDDGYIKISRATKALACKINYYVEELRNRENRSVTIEELASHFEVEPQEIVFAMESTKMPISIYDKGDDEQVQSIDEKLSEGDKSEQLVDNFIIKEGIRRLTERERKIIILRYYKDKTQSEVAKELNVSQVQISRLESKIIEKLRAEFK